MQTEVCQVFIVEREFWETFEKSCEILFEDRILFLKLAYEEIKRQEPALQRRR